MDDRYLVSQLLSQARRRYLTHLVLDQSALALTIGMGGAILLLLAGTQILDWYWVALLTAVSLGIGLYRIRNRIPTLYQLAQRIDRRLNLADSLSTATYFSSEDAHGDRAIRERQHQEAENIARSVDVRAAVPYHRPRFAYAALGVTLVAAGLFAVRYAVTGSLSLRPSLVQMAFDTFFPPQQQLAKAKKLPDRFKAPGDENANTPDTPSDEKPDAELKQNDAPDQENQQTADSKQQEKDKQAEPQDQKPGDNADKGEKSDKNDADQKDAKQGEQKGDKQQNGKQDSQQNAQNDSLMDKLRDAMSNMMNKMKQSSKQGDQPQQNAQKGQQSQSDKNQKQSAKNQDQKANPDAQSDQQNNSADQKQTAQAHGNEKSSDKDASQDSKSGVGSADGDKTAKQAEELNAMGKISEILGKRSQNVTGEMMVEVGSSKQQLKTPFMQKQATHVEAGSEIHRDEVPLMYQQFVEQYFEEIHKAPPAPPKKN